MASDIWLRTILIVRKETRCRHIGYSYRLTARVILYAPSHRQDNTYHGLCYTSRGALAGTRLFGSMLTDRAVLRRCGAQLGPISVGPGSQSTCIKVCRIGRGAPIGPIGLRPALHRGTFKQEVDWNTPNW